MAQGTDKFKLEKDLQWGCWTAYERKPDGEEQALLEEKTRGEAEEAAQEVLADCADENLFPTLVILNPVNEGVLTMWIENGQLITEEEDALSAGPIT
jgi:hypothetical protein